MRRTPSETDSDRQKALEAAVGHIEKQFGRGAIMRLGERAVQPTLVLPSGSLALDIALGVGGYPRGRIVEIFGPEASGKTTLALHALAEAQKRGGTGAIIDAEHALDPHYARNLGVDMDNLWISQPECGEDALEIADILVRSNAIDVIVVDSVAALVPRAELEGEMGDAHVGAQARLMSQALRKLAGSVARTQTVAIFTNQIREKIGVMFGSPETTPGGRALKFWASVRLRIRKAETLKVGNENIGSRVVVQVVKNKVAPPFKEAAFDILYGKGISWTADVLDLGVEHGLITRSGTWFSYGDLRLGQGRDNAREFLDQHPEVAEEIAQRIREKVGLPPLVSEGKPSLRPEEVRAASP